MAGDAMRRAAAIAAAGRRYMSILSGCKQSNG